MVKQNLQDTFSQFDNFNVLIIGDVMIDAYLWGAVNRISPEAPVPIIQIEKRENRMGGAANVGLNIRALGAKPIMCAIIGDDDKGKEFEALLQKRNMTNSGILKSSSRKTTVKTRVISDGQHLLRVDDESEEAINENLEQAFIEHINKVFANQDLHAIIFEDYDKGNITPAIIDHVVALAKENNIPTLVDPKKRNFNAYKGVSLFKPNFKEICEGVKVDLPKGDFKALHNAANKLKDSMQLENVMVTLSELGVFITEKDTYHQLPAQIRDIADVSGAGDTVISVASCCLAAQLPLDKVAAISNIAGGLVCEKVGVVPIDKAQLLDESVRFFEQNANLS